MKRLRKKLKLNLNKKTILTFQDKEGNLASAAFRIFAIYKTINAPYDDSNVFVKITMLIRWPEFQTKSMKLRFC